MSQNQEDTFNIEDALASISRMKEQQKEAMKRAREFKKTYQTEIGGNDKPVSQKELKELTKRIQKHKKDNKKYLKKNKGTYRPEPEEPDKVLNAENIKTSLAQMQEKTRESRKAVSNKW